MKTQSFVSVITLLLLLTTSLQAGVIPGRWEKVDSQPAGALLAITLKSGDGGKYAFTTSDATTLTVSAKDGAELTLPKADVARIVQRKRPSRTGRTKRGAAIGGAAGAFGGAAASIIVRTRGEFVQPWSPLWFIPFGLIGAAAGGMIGWSTGPKPADEVLYQAP